MIAKQVPAPDLVGLADQVDFTGTTSAARVSRSATGLPTSEDDVACSMWTRRVGAPYVQPGPHVQYRDWDGTTTFVTGNADGTEDWERLLPTSSPISGTGATNPEFRCRNATPKTAARASGAVRWR